MNDEKRKQQTRDRLVSIAAEHRRLISEVEAIENTRDAEIMAARKLGMTQQEIADLLGLSKMRISQIEKGTR